MRSEYSRHLIIGHVGYSKGEYVSDSQMVRQLNGDLNSGQKLNVIIVQKFRVLFDSSRFFRDLRFVIRIYCFK